MGKVLVTGANGFIGSHICEAFLDSGYEIRALVRRTSDLSNLASLDIELAYGDLSDIESLDAAVAGMEIIINNAGLTKALNKRDFALVNIEGTRNILGAVVRSNPGIRRFVQISSQAAAGPSDNLVPIDEDSDPKPVSEYGRSKLGAETAAIDFKGNFPLTILRPTAVFGPRDKEMLSFFKAIKLGLKPTFGKGNCYSNFTYVKDLASAVVAASRAETVSGSIYFVADKKYYSYAGAGEIIRSRLGNKAILVHLPIPLIILAGRVSEMIAGVRGKPHIFSADKALEMTRKYWLVDSTKIEREIGFVCSTSFEDGVRDTIEWYRRHKWL